MDSMVKVYFYTVYFFIRNDEQNYTQIVTGTPEILQKFCDSLKTDDSVDSVAAVYVCTISPMDTSPVVVKQIKENK